MELNKIFNMDCIAGMSIIPDGAVDLILADLPYGVTGCSWDSLLPLDQLWRQYERVIKPNGAIVLTACQPFTTTLIQSNRKRFPIVGTGTKILQQVSHLPNINQCAVLRMS